MEKVLHLLRKIEITISNGVVSQNDSITAMDDLLTTRVLQME